MLSINVKLSADNILKYFSYFSQKTGFDISCKLSPLETICMKCQILFSGKNKKNINYLSSAELAKRVVKVKDVGYASPEAEDSAIISWYSAASKHTKVLQDFINI